MINLNDYRPNRNILEGQITVDMLQYVNRWFVREETLKAANAILVNYHHQLPQSAVWGAGVASSSDGQRFGLQQNSLLASFYPRYFGSIFPYNALGSSVIIKIFGR